MRLKQAVKLLHALSWAINKATCRWDKRLKQPCPWFDGKYFIFLNKSKVKEEKLVLQISCKLLQML